MTSISRLAAVVLASMMAACVGSSSGKNPPMSPSPLPYPTSDQIAAFAHLPDEKYSIYAQGLLGPLDCKDWESVQRTHRAEMDRAKAAFIAMDQLFAEGGGIVRYTIQGKRPHTLVLHAPEDFPAFQLHWELAELIRARCPSIKLDHYSLEMFKFHGDQGKPVPEKGDYDNGRELDDEYHIANLIEGARNIQKILLEGGNSDYPGQAARIINMYDVLKETASAEDWVFNHIIKDHKENKWLKKSEVLIAVLEHGIVTAHAYYLLRWATQAKDEKLRECIMGYFDEIKQREEDLRTSLFSLGLLPPKYAVIMPNWDGATKRDPRSSACRDWMGPWSELDVKQQPGLLRLEPPR